MSEWRRRWVITLRWDNPANSPYGQDRYVFTVGAHQLGEMVRAARADPHIVAFPYQGTWRTEGDQPQQCPAGHPFGGGSATRPRSAWYQCPGCPGHHAYRCRHGDGRSCPELLDPPPGPYCRPHPPAAQRPTHHP